MHTIWSDCIQGIGTLYASRSLQFSDYFKEKYMSAFGLEDGRKILEIGCGPGALAESLKRWYPKSQIFGVDRDSNFIEFASRKNPSISFSEGDAAHLAFEEESFDVTVSNTVAEHIAPAEFYGEQYRVLKKGGVCLVLSARKGINIAAQCIAAKSESEIGELKRIVNEKYDKRLELYDMGRKQWDANVSVTMIMREIK